MRERSKVSFKNILKVFSWNSIFIKYFKKTVAIVIIPFLFLEIIAGFYISNENKNKTDTVLNNTFVKTCYIFDKAIGDAGKQIYLLMNNNSIVSMVTSDSINNDYASQKTLMKNAIAVSQYIDSIDVYSVKSGYVFSTDTSEWIENFAYLPWYDYYAENGDTNFVIPSKSTRDKTHYDRLSISQGMYYDGKLYGIIVCKLKIDDLFEDIGVNSENETIFMLDKTGKVVYAENQEIINEILDDGIDFKQTEFIYSISKADADNEIMYKYDLGYMGTAIVSSFNLKKLADNNVSKILILILSGVFILIMTFVLSLYLTKQYYASISDIIRYIQQDSIGMTDNRANENNELGFIIKSISSIIENKEELERKLSENIQNLKKAQSAMLQYQFNPHFLFNVLNVINLRSIALTHSENDVSRIVKLLSELMRITLSSESYFTTIMEEVDFADKYIEIEKIRYHYDFEVEWDIEREILKNKTIKLILQPIIENAFSHGLHNLPPEKKKQIKISAKRNGDDIEFYVIDNGEPIDEEKINRIQEDLENGVIKYGKNIGIRNVNNRIKLIFGEKYGCKITRENGFTIVKIKIPNKKMI